VTRFGTFVLDASLMRIFSWSLIARVVVRGILATLFRIRTQGELPSRGPLLVVANHQGWVDGFLLAAAFPLRAPVRFLGDRQGTMGVWWHRAILRRVGLIIAIDRVSAWADRSALQATLQALRRGEIVVVFAEGRVSRAESTLGPFARGVGYLALRSGAPVLPVWLSGTAELYVGRELALTIGKPRAMPPETPTKEATRRIAETMHDDLAALARPWRDPAVERKRWRWLTDLF
jgi:acyl-[acyl-carrier-protein]-phospholipid O-acyltransferase / long-chain-fatty-acid--[acyl-carrier-protein] ligase